MNTQPEISDGKSIAITSYILVVGALIALSMNAENKNKFAAFHIRQAIGLSITFIGLGSIISYFPDPRILFPMWIFISILWTYGIVTAVKGQTIPVPLLGKFYQKLFKSI
ncbi:membrane protein [Flavobacterium beibuense F44-8]|uniref:Membrane protein n=1 Tax=Flavobacterium beibuense F44-8 TaxID=1406840 RepID=A0A0A2LTP1_9FLAO|nr:membrane protein [Flavobacterium beibuense]KGO82633.1 membrane protein [Flavobacterium beibuense F44-8]